MNILDNSALRACTSCQMCGAVCAKNAISITLDKDGFYRPVVDESLCVDCGLCVKVCHKFEEDIRMTTDAELADTQLYAAAAKSDDLVRATTSGGVADLLAKQLIAEGYKVVGVAYDPESNRAIHQVAETAEQTDAFRGSKYIQSYCMEAFRTLVKDCKTQKYAVFGLPCQIYAISRYLERIQMRDNCMLIDLYCHGCPSMHVWTKVSEKVRNTLGCKSFDKAIWRSKHRGWGKFVLEAHGDNGKHFVSRPMNNEFFDLFFCNQVLNESCTDCKLRGTLAYTDIRLGDFWGKEYDKTFRGMSAVSLVTEKAKKLFCEIQNDLTTTQKDYSTFLPYQSWAHVYKVDEGLRKELLMRLSDPKTSIKDCVMPLYRRRSMKAKVTVCVKQVLSYLPNSIENKVRKFIK